jgi:hypothetical protein
LADQKGTGLLVDNPSGYAGKRGELGGKGQARRPAADDKDVNFRGQAVHLLHRGPIRWWLYDGRVAWRVTVQVELHVQNSSSINLPGTYQPHSRRCLELGWFEV